MTNEAKLESAISALCVSCGLCCDGTLFKQANLKDKKDSALADSLGLKVIEKQGKFPITVHLASLIMLRDICLTKTYF